MKLFADMVFGHKYTVSLLVLFLTLGGISKPAYADLTFNYSGPAFSIPECDAIGALNTTCTGGSITGSITIPASLVAAGGYVFATQFTSWTLNGPTGDLSSSSGNLMDPSSFIYLSNGQPLYWDFEAFNSNLGSYPETGIFTNWSGPGCACEDYAELVYPAPGPSDMDTIGIILTTQPGTWTVGGGTIAEAALGGFGDVPGEKCAGDPCNAGTGNEYEQITDYTTSGQNPLSFTRYYNSLASNTDPYATELGSHWRSNFDRYLTISPGGGVTIYRADGQVLQFNGVMNTTTDIDIQLVNSSPTWYLTDHEGNVETYNQLASGEALLQKIVARDGYTQTLSYNAQNQLTSVTDSYGRTLSFTYANGLLAQVTTPDSLVLIYSYTSSGLTPGVNDQMASVSYNTSPATQQVYSYVNNFDLASITDEDGNIFASWTYDTQNRALTSQHAGGADLVTIAYNDTNGSRTVTNALGQQTIYNFTTLQGVPKITGISRTASSTVPAGTESFTYDSNGYTASKTDWNGNTTNYTNDIHGDPTTITEAAGTAQARTTIITYAGTLPLTITAPRETTAFTYDANGDPLTRTETDTSGGSTNGQVRTWNFTYDSTGHVLTATSPLGAVTTYTYTGNNIATVTDALGHVSKITSYNGSGQPLSMTDPNGVVTTLTYDTRNRITSRTIDGATTSFAYDAAGNLITITLPDGSELLYTYDAAHRVIAVKNNVGETINYTLDADGDITQQQVAGTSITKTQSAVFDSLGRMLQQIGAYNETTAFAYDSDGNTLTTTDALNNATAQSFDALNRLIQSIDPLHNATSYAFDPQDNLTSVTDPRTLITSYVYDGFKEVISQTSPDTGTTTYTLDAMGNRIGEKDARGVITNRTFDKLNRVLTETYPPTMDEDVAYTYDEGKFGVGHLSSFKDQSGSTAFTYNARGDILTDTRKIDGKTYDTSYTYDLADHVASITYPSGNTITYARDKFGRISAVAVQGKACGRDKPENIASNVTYEPFGPVSGFTFGNDVAETFTYDLDYRLTSILAKGKTTIQSLTLAYDGVNDIKSIADNEKAQLNQAFTYDADYRLLTAIGKYGAEAFSYDPDGNRTSETKKGRTSTYAYAATSNQLDSITGADRHAFTYDASGNTTTETADRDKTFIYNARNRNSEIDVRDERGFGSVKYLYNALGERVSKDPQGKDHEFNQGLTHFIYDTDGNLIAEADSFGGISKEYVLMDGLPIAELEGDDIHYIHTDHLGTPQKMTDADQKVVWSRVAEPFGETLRIDGPATLNIRGRGQYHDSESGLLYNLNRSLDPRSNIYTQSDPTGLLGGINPRIHVGQNPINRVDPSGLDEMAPGTWNWLLNPPSTNGSQCSSSSVSPSYPYPYFTPQNFMDNLLLLGMLVPALGEFAATGEGALDIGIDQKIFNQMDSRGWNSNSIQSTVDDPYATSSALNKATGENATAYYNADGSYVVRDNSTGQIIQISNKNNSNWIPDSSIKNPYKP